MIMKPLFASIEFHDVNKTYKDDINLVTLNFGDITRFKTALLHACTNRQKCGPTNDIFLNMHKVM